MTKNNPRNLKELIKQGYLYPAWFLEKNDFLFNKGGVKLKTGNYKTVKEVIENLNNLNNLTADCSH